MRSPKTIVTSARNEKVSLRWRQWRRDLRSLKRAMSSLSSLSALAFSASTSRCVCCTLSSSASRFASADSASARRLTALSTSASAAAWRCASFIAAASASVTHIRLVRTACIHSSMSFSDSAASTTDSPLECERRKQNDRPRLESSATSRTLHSSSSTTPEGLSRKPVKSLGELKYMSTLSRSTNQRRFHLWPFSCPPPSLERKP
mmetsp:Transcript_24949/g.68454  ORF Transcript_24949/g.68454 Transcript_24949/m.68454 type:complete len:205 (+) Transcript_24949:1180-1794(+)